jgi:hypothetical protein
MGASADSISVCAVQERTPAPRTKSPALSRTTRKPPPTDAAEWAGASTGRGQLSPMEGDKGGKQPHTTTNTWTKPPATGTLSVEAILSASKATVDLEEAEPVSQSGPTTTVLTATGSTGLGEREKPPVFLAASKAASADIRAVVAKEQTNLTSTVILWDESEPTQQHNPTTTSTATAANLHLESTAWQVPAQALRSSLSTVLPAAAGAGAAAAAGDLDVSDFVREHKSLFHSWGCNGNGTPAAPGQDLAASVKEAQVLQA